jgi:hypothetical protein
MLLCNHKIAEDKVATFILYAIVEKVNSVYKIKLVSWLNWLHSIHGSFEKGYAFISELNASKSWSIFSQMSDICCFKALYPLLSQRW